MSTQDLFIDKENLETLPQKRELLISQLLHGIQFEIVTKTKKHVNLEIRLVDLRDNLPSIVIRKVDDNKKIAVIAGKIENGLGMILDKNVGEEYRNLGLMKIAMGYLFEVFISRKIFRVSGEIITTNMSSLFSRIKAQSPLTEEYFETEIRQNKKEKNKYEVITHLNRRLKETPIIPIELKGKVRQK